MQKTQEVAGLIPGSGRSPGGGHGNPLWYACLEKSQGQRSLAVYGVTKSRIRLKELGTHVEVLKELELFCFFPLMPANVCLSQLVGIKTSMAMFVGSHHTSADPISELSRQQRAAQLNTV